MQTSHKYSPNKSTPFGQQMQAATKQRRNKKTGKKHPAYEEKAPLHNWWRIHRIRISSRNNGRIQKRQDRFCIKLYIIFYEIRFVILLYGSTSVIRTKTLFFNTGEITNFSHENQNPKHYFFFLTDEIATKFSVTNSKFKTTDVILMCLEILLYKHKAVIKVSGIVKQTVSRK